MLDPRICLRKQASKVTLLNPMMITYDPNWLLGGYLFLIRRLVLEAVASESCAIYAGRAVSCHRRSRCQQSHDSP